MNRMISYCMPLSGEQKVASNVFSAARPSASVEPLQYFAAIGMNRVQACEFFALHKRLTDRA